MHYRRLGNSGLCVSEIALGTWLTFGNGIDDATARVCVETAFEYGVNFFDTADVYAGGEAERVLGQSLRKYDRKDYVLATKCYFPMSEDPNDRGLSRKHIVESVEASLRRLDTGYIDLYQCHRFDEKTPLQETVRAMDDLIHAGKILYWGVSQWTAAQIEQVGKIADQLSAARPISNQPIYSMLSRGVEESIMPACAKEGLGLVVFSPLAQGLLTGKYTSADSLPKQSRAADEKQNVFMEKLVNPESVEKSQRIASIADQLNVPPATLALAWCLRRPEVASVICGASRPEQIVQNVSASGVKIADDMLAAIEQVLSGPAR
jgi:voltage-dependent potassium channel beta subunit